jgi:NitT/TauT family transport system permease protein
MTALLKTSWARRAIALGFLVAVWEIAARMGLLNPLFFPAPSQVGKVAADLAIDGGIWTHLQATFTAALGGLALGLAIGILLGFLAALVPILAVLLEPVMILLNAIPRVIMAPLFVIWLGIDLGSKIALAVVLVAVLIFFAVYSGIKEVDRRLVERVITLGGNRWVLVREVYIPSVTAQVMGSLKVAVGFAFTGAVVGEFVASTRGLGYLLQFAQSTYNAALSFALILLIMVFVLVLFSLAEALEHRLLRWRHR